MFVEEIKAFHRASRDNETQMYKTENKNVQQGETQEIENGVVM